MCAAVTLFTGNIYTAIAVHSLFDIGGFLYEEFGGGTLWTSTNVIVTAVIPVICAAAIVIAFFKTDASWVYDKFRLNERPDGIDDKK